MCDGSLKTKNMGLQKINFIGLAGVIGSMSDFSFLVLICVLLSSFICRSLLLGLLLTVAAMWSVE
jgi:hypothetical protein